MKFVFHKAILDTPAYYEDTATKQRYRRIVGGISWPQEEEKGVALVLAENQDDPPKFKVLVSVEDFNGLDLIAKAKALELEYPVTTWHGNPHNLPMMVLLHEFNRDKYPENKLRFQGAPLAGEKNNSGYYLPMLIELGKVGADRMSASESPSVLTALSTMHPETHFNRDIAKFPALAALCYPLSWLLTYKAGMQRVPAKVDYKKYGGAGWQL